MAPPVEPIDAVSQRLERFTREQADDAADLGAEAAAFVEAGARTLDGGKRLRARFCLTGWAAVAGAGDADAPRVPGDDVICAAAALEVFQAAALVHDDIIDNSDTRRGRPSSHRHFEAGHRAQGWRGHAERFGRSAGILLGDLLVAWSDDLLETGLEASPHHVAARRVYARMRREVTIGQFLDVAEEAAHRSAPDDRHAERALRVASLKSARYSVERPLLLGAALAGARDEQSRALSGFGHPIGMAFQLRDDVLGVFGDPAVTGKPAGDDLREGKRTLLIAYAREALPETGRAEIDAALGDARLDDARIAALQAAIVGSGALDRVERLIGDYVGEADHALADAESRGLLAAAPVAALRALAHAAVTRSA
ncbi:polyprenyl synthetase family protein [Microbacterium sp. No. 7]|uniref:polyprenyl synthetase family protein n=1 Tax=Microbacterium sp. No. 7 TaxID=1714373 RepID=UPI0006D03762|nr:polyprenyl synthetase family protein [Microbacterium sp. No. 7]ALJ20819.1 geranylgeranyl pyrophosphate synthase [Microbacterium sp. No. 7]